MNVSVQENQKIIFSSTEHKCINKGIGQNNDIIHLVRPIYQQYGFLQSEICCPEIWTQYRSKGGYNLLLQ